MCLQNKALRCQVCANFDGANQIIDNATNLHDNDKDSDKNNDIANDNNNHVDSNSSDMMEESIEGLSLHLFEL